MSKRTYILVTAARNEEKLIEGTLRAVTKQTVPPVKWIIVSDGSTDGTDDLVSRYAHDHPFIQLLRREPDPDRNFSSKAHAIAEAYARCDGIPSEYVGVLDADVSFESRYYDQVMEKFEDNERLGIAGGILYDQHDGQYIRQPSNTAWSVSGPIQMFRRICFDTIGGYLPLRRGGVDAVAEVMARKNGWEVRAFEDLKVMHHRKTSTKKGNALVSIFRDGIKEYAYGCHPLFEIAKCGHRIKQSPAVIGSVLRWSGYVWGFLSREPIPIPRDVVQFLRREQLQRLKTLGK